MIVVQVVLPSYLVQLSSSCCSVIQQVGYKLHVVHRVGMSHLLNISAGIRFSPDGIPDSSRGQGVIRGQGVREMRATGGCHVIRGARARGGFGARGLGRGVG